MELSNGIPNMGVRRYAKETVHISPSHQWKSYLGHATVQIMRNFLSHEEAHLLLHRMGLHKASRCLDNFTPFFSYPRKHHVNNERQREIDEPSGLENLILAVERKRKKVGAILDNSATTPIYPIPHSDTHE